MKLHLPRRDAGSALMLATIAVLLMAGIGAALFSLAMSEQKTTHAATRADAAYYVAEAGLDDAVNKLKVYSATVTTSTDATALADLLDKADFAVIGTVLKDADGSTYNEVTGSFNDGTYTVKIEPAYTGVGDYRVQSVGTFNGERRGVETWLTAADIPTSSPFGLFGDVFMYAGGNVTTDGYASAKGTYASQAVNKVDIGGGKIKTFANKTGSIGSNGNVQVGDAAGTSSVVIYGNATSGPKSTVTVNSGSKVFGTTTPAKAATPIPSTDYTVPAGTTALKAISASTTITGGTYSTTSLNPKGGVVTIKGDVVLYVSGDIEFHSKMQISITAGSTLKIYQSSSTAKLTMNAQSILNTNQNPSTFSVYSNVSAGTLNGGADFYGVIYAPNTSMKINGNSALYGSTTAKQINITGTADFHYDESLGSEPSKIITFSVKAYEAFIPDQD